MSGKAKMLLVISTLFTLAMGLSNVFVNIFLWKKSDDFMVIGWYNLMHYIFVPLTFIAAGWLSKRKNGIWPLRIGVALFTLFFVLFLMLQKQVTAYVIPLGILFGIASGFYWLAYNVLSFDFTSTGNRDSFNGYNGALAGIAGAVAPFTAAYVIHNLKGTTGYSVVFTASLVIFAVLVVLTFFIRSKYYGSRLEFGRLFTNCKSSEWKLMRLSTAAWGLRDVVIGFLITVLIFQQTGSELSVGKFALIAAVISSTAFVLEQKLIKPGRRILSMHLGAVLMFVAAIGLVFKISYMTLLVYIILDAAFSPFFLVPLSSASFNVIDENREKELRAEYVINREIVLNAGRIASTAAFMIILLLFKAGRNLNYFLLFLGMAQFASLFYLRKMKVWDMPPQPEKKRE